jgi:hypothetical protein
MVLNKKIVALPVDGRPVVREQVCQLLNIADWQLLVPTVEALGDFRIPANHEQLRDWLFANADDADGFVLSIDMLVYGGLIPSRFIDDDIESLRARLQIVTALKHRYPQKPIYCFAATMRLSNNNVNEEEKIYWDQFGELIWRWSFFSDRFLINRLQEDKNNADSAKRAIPEIIRTDYLATRQRNFSITLEALKLVDEHKIDRLILPQDDTAEYGFNIAERRQLHDEITKRSLGDRVLIYPGADEVIHTLSAFMVSTLKNSNASKFYLALSDPIEISNLCARYEDRPILDSIAAQINAVGGLLVEQVDEADIVLAIHTSGRVQGDWAMRQPLEKCSVISQQWLDTLAIAHQHGVPVHVCDLAYANGADPVFIEALTRVIPLCNLVGYAGWNTASNSIGCLVAQAVLAIDKPASDVNKKIVCLRLVEDYLYQAIWRQRIRDVIDETSLSPEGLQKTVATMFVPAANEWLARHGFMWRVTSVYLPWNRTFEIGINLDVAST